MTAEGPKGPFTVLYCSSCIAIVNCKLEISDLTYKWIVCDCSSRSLKLNRTWYPRLVSFIPMHCWCTSANVDRCIFDYGRSRARKHTVGVWRVASAILEQQTTVSSSHRLPRLATASVCWLHTIARCSIEFSYFFHSSRARTTRSSSRSLCGSLIVPSELSYRCQHKH